MPRSHSLTDAVGAVGLPLSCARSAAVSQSRSHTVHCVRSLLRTAGEVCDGTGPRRHWCAVQGVGAFAESVLLAKSVLPDASARAVLLQWANHLAARNMCERAVQVSWAHATRAPVALHTGARQHGTLHALPCARRRLGDGLPRRRGALQVYLALGEWERALLLLAHLDRTILAVHLVRRPPPPLRRRCSDRRVHSAVERCNPVCCVATRCAVLQRVVLRCNPVCCVATRCAVLRRGVLCCDVLCCVAACCAVWQPGVLCGNPVCCVATCCCCVATCCAVLRRVVLCCNGLCCVAMCCAVLRRGVLCGNPVCCVTTWCAVLQPGVLCCDVLCCVATCCAVLQPGVLCCDVLD